MLNRKSLLVAAIGATVAAAALSTPAQQATKQYDFAAMSCCWFSYVLLRLGPGSLYRRARPLGSTAADRTSRRPAQGAAKAANGPDHARGAGGPACGTRADDQSRPGRPSRTGECSGMNVPAVLAALSTGDPPAVGNRDRARSAPGWAALVVRHDRRSREAVAPPERLAGTGPRGDQSRAGHGVRRGRRGVRAAGATERAFGAGRLSVDTAQHAAGVWLAPVVAGVVLAVPLLPLRSASGGLSPWPAGLSRCRPWWSPALPVARSQWTGRPTDGSRARAAGDLLLGDPGLRRIPLVPARGAHRPRSPSHRASSGCGFALLCGGTGLALAAVQALTAADAGGVPVRWCSSPASPRSPLR